MRSVLHILVARYSVFSLVCLQFSSRVVRHGFDVKSCCGLPGHERKKNSFRCMQGALGTVAEQNQTTGQGTRLVDVLCGEESDTPQGSEPVAKQARTDDYSMNVGQVTPPVGCQEEKQRGLKVPMSSSCASW